MFTSATYKYYFANDFILTYVAENPKPPFAMSWQPFLGILTSSALDTAIHAQLRHAASYFTRLSISRHLNSVWNIDSYI